MALCIVARARTRMGQIMHYSIGAKSRWTIWEWYAVQQLGRWGREKGCTRKDVPSQVPGTKVDLRKRKEKEEEANVTRCNVNAMQLKVRTGGEEKNNWQNTMQGGRADIGLGKILLPVASTVFVPKPCRGEWDKQERKTRCVASETAWEVLFLLVADHDSHHYPPPYRVACF